MKDIARAATEWIAIIILAIMVAFCCIGMPIMLWQIGAPLWGILLPYEVGSILIAISLVYARIYDWSHKGE